jgi:hypothetical protein
MKLYVEVGHKFCLKCCVHVSINKNGVLKVSGYK